MAGLISGGSEAGPDTVADVPAVGKLYLGSSKIRNHQGVYLCGWPFSYATCIN